jgi:phage/plasmid-like protein (TIGR03299 family)
MIGGTLFDSILTETLDRAGGPRIIREENNLSRINWQAGVADATEMLKVGRGKDGVAMGLARAALNTRNGTVSMFSALVSPWHGLGKVIDRAASAAEALELANLNGWDLQKIRAFCDFNGISIPTESYGIIRGDTGDLLGTVGNKYQIVSNEDCFSIMDALTSEGGMKYETAGAIGKGATAWMLAQMPERVEVVPGDEVVPYLLCSTSHDGSAAIRIFPTADRVVCRNTLRVAKLGGRGKGISLRHTKSVKDRVKQAQQALGLVRRDLATFKTQTAQLTSTQVYPHEYFAACLDDILDVTIAERKVTAAALKDGTILDSIMKITSLSDRKAERDRLDRAIDRRKELLTDILNRYESPRNNGMTGIAGTGWAAYNAVSENIDHSPLWRANKDAETRFERVLLGAGDDAKQVAFQNALALTAN